MKRILLLLAALCAAELHAQSTVVEDSLGEDPLADIYKVYGIQKVEVMATHNVTMSAVAVSSFWPEEKERNSYGQDFPYLLALTPSMVATSETGIGIGATSMRMRGTDATRLNVTVNGVPLNNPDSHAMYWYDTPDLISSVGSVRVQRGAGMSTNGTGAFGGAIVLATDQLSPDFEGDVSLSYGSYNSNKQGVHVSSGLLNDRWVIDARLTHIGSDGYVDRGATDLTSYMFQCGYYTTSSLLKFVSFGGKAKTYLTYTGVTKEEMELYGRRYHTEGQYYTSDGPYVLADGSHVNYYDNHTDNYLQFNNQLLFTHVFNGYWSMNVTAHYTYGDGYYVQYKDDAKLLEYGFSKENSYDASGEKIRKDLIREKLMYNHFGGLNAMAIYNKRPVEISIGGSWSYYACPHWGELDWVQDSPAGFNKGMRWYDNNVNKQDANIFVDAWWMVNSNLRLIGDIQYRYVDYRAWGVNDNYDAITGGMQKIDVDKQYHFFNPKIGLNYDFPGYNSKWNHAIGASFAIAQKEPTRSDFTDRFREEFPSAEKLYDYEAYYRFSAHNISGYINFYYMYYRNQLVKTGQINDNYDALNINVPKSYRRGIEVTLSGKPAKWFTVSANATFSQNRILDYTNKVADWDGGYNETYMGTTVISYSPEVIAGLILDFHVSGFSAVMHTQYVGDQYFTNYANPNMKLDAYCVTNLDLGYSFKTRNAKSVRFGLAVYNLFNAKYANNGYGYSEYYSDGDGAPKTQHDTAYYFPQAPINFLANVTVKF